LDQSDIYDPGWLPTPTSYHAYLRRVDRQKGFESFYPLVHEFAPMDQNQGVTLSLGNERGSYNGLTKCSGCGKYSKIVRRERCERRRLDSA
jgi:hypothetical protein